MGASTTVCPVLVVEDDPIQMEALCGMLEAISGTFAQYGLRPFTFDIRRATTGEEAWSMILNVPFAMAFVDITLPGITGLDLSWCYSQHLVAELDADNKQQQQQSGQRQAVVIACSSSKVDPNDASVAGMSDILVKPVTMSALRHVLHKWMPRLSSPEDDDPTATSRTSGPKRSKSDVLHSTRILQVEDCRIAATAVERLFQSLGFWIDSAIDGETAMSLLASRQYALVLLDVELPSMSGYAVASWYKDHCKSNGLRPATVVAVTATPDIEACREFGIDRCLPKPLTSEVVTQLSRQWITGEIGDAGRLQGSPVR